MAALVAIVAGSLVSSSIGAALGGTLFATAIGAVAGGLTSSLVGGALGDTPSAPTSQNFDGQARGTLLNAASTVEPIPVVYGSRRVGGPRIFTHVNGPNNRFLHLVYVVSEGTISRIGAIYLDGVPLTDARFAGCTLYANRHLGADSQTVDTDLMSYVPTKWTSAHRGQGVAYLALALVYTQQAFPTGLPVVTMDVDGIVVTDFRDSVVKFSSNPALCIADYRQNARYGMGLAAALHDFAGTWTAIANHCEGRESVVASSAAVTAVDCGADTLSLNDGTVDGMLQARLGDGVQLTTTGTLPAGLALLTTYYVIRTDDVKIQLATSFANAMAGTAVNITDTGSGTHTVNHIDMPRYTLDGSLDIDQLPIDNVRDMLSTMFRGSIWPSGGTYRLGCDRAAAATSFGFTEDNIVGAWQIMGVQKKDKLNRVRAGYFNPAAQWKPDIAIYENATWRSDEDAGSLLDRQIQLPFTANAYRAQNLAQLEARDSRYGVVAKFNATIAGHRAEVFDVVPVTHSTPGWSALSMRVRNMRLLSSDEVEVVVREYEDIYTLTAPAAMNFPVTTTLPNYFTMITQAPPRVSGLEIFGQGTTTTFAGKDCKFAWRRRSNFASGGNGADQGAAGQGDTDFTFRDFYIEVRKTDLTLLRADSSVQPEYIYSYERNAEDTSGTPVRAFGINIWQRSKYGLISSLPAHLDVSNPAPALGAVTLAGIAGGFSASFTVPSDLDYAGTRLHASTTTGFTPGTTNVVANITQKNGQVANYQVTGLQPGITYYVVAIPYDVFGDGSAIAEQSVTPKLPIITGYLGANDGQGMITQIDSVDTATSLSNAKVAGPVFVPKTGLLYVIGENQAGGNVRLKAYDPATLTLIVDKDLGVSGGVTIAGAVYAPSSGYIYCAQGTGLILEIDPVSCSLVSSFSGPSGRTYIPICYSPLDGYVFLTDTVRLIWLNPLTHAFSAETSFFSLAYYAGVYMPSCDRIVVPDLTGKKTYFIKRDLSGSNNYSHGASSPLGVLDYSPVNDRIYIPDSAAGVVTIRALKPDFSLDASIVSTAGGSVSAIIYLPVNRLIATIEGSGVSFSLYTYNPATNLVVASSSHLSIVSVQQLVRCDSVRRLVLADFPSDLVLKTLTL